MGKKSIRISMFSFLFLFLQAYIFAHSLQDVRKGEIIDKIVCKDNLEQSYALFLPPGYSPEKTWPILYAFDPGARGRIPLEHFKEAAQKYGYIVVGSNNSRNGPWPPVMEASMAVWTDTHERFSIDEKRVYATGFSGGSRAASAFSKFVNHPVAGIIGIGAGLPQELKPVQVKPSVYYGIVGIGDFNYQPMMRLDEEFDKWDVLHRFLVYDGEHKWPPQEICTRAVEWMEILPMKQGLRPLDNLLIDKIFTTELEKARMMEENGQIYRAVSEYTAIASGFKEWKDTEAISDKINLFKQSKEYKQYLNDEKERREREDTFRNGFINAFARILKYPEWVMNLDEIYSELGIRALQNKVKNKKDIDEHALFFRLLTELTIHSIEEGRRHYEKEDHEMAIVFYEIAAKASEHKSSSLQYIYYELACFYALNNQKRKALKKLKLSIENGFYDIETIENDEDLNSLKDSTEFQRIIKDLKEKKSKKWKMET
jgi:hypothetical protein